MKNTCLVTGSSVADSMEVLFSIDTIFYKKMKENIIFKDTFHFYLYNYIMVLTFVTKLISNCFASF